MCEENSAQRPNILLITADQLRRSDLGCYGNRCVQTPAIDRLCREGVRFDNSVSASPVCAPYRATLQSGLYPHQHGIESNNDLLCPHFKGLAEYFNEAGYETCFVGKSHFGRDEIPEKDGWVRPENRLGWKHWHGTGGDHHYDTPYYQDTGELDRRFYGQYGAEVRTGLAVRCIREYRESPWLVQVNYSEPHIATMPALYEMPATRERIRVLNEKLGLGLTPGMLDNPNPLSFYDSFPQHLLTQLLPQKYLDLYDPGEIPLEEGVPEAFQHFTRWLLREIYAMITCLDDQVARLMEALRDSGQLERTIVVFTSDHGDMLSNGYLRFKGVPYQNAWRTPFLVWGPGRGIAPGRTDALINSVDVLPTLLGLAGLRPDRALPGVSLAPAVYDGAAQVQEEVLLGLADWRAIWDGRYFYAVKKGPDGIRPERLTDTVQDPHDLHNLAGRPEHRALQAALERRLFSGLQRIADSRFLECERR